MLLPRVGAVSGAPAIHFMSPFHLFPANLGVAACPGLNESAVQVGAVRELYAWVLQVPEPDLAMTFQEVSALSSYSKPQPW